MFVRKKTIKGRQYYYLVRSVRDGSTIRQVYLEYIGPAAPTEKQLKKLVKKHGGKK